MRISFILFFLISGNSIGQSITQVQQKALNNYVVYANQSAKEVNTLVSGIIAYYPSIKNAKVGSSFQRNYTYGLQLEQFYFTQALQTSKSLNTAATSLNVKLKSLQRAAEKLDNNCKALDTYYKLEDYKKDNYAKAETIINDLSTLLIEYKQQQVALQDELESVYQKLNKSISTNPYHQSNAMMRQQIKKEKAFIDSWTFNLEEEIHTGWPVDKLEQSITETSAQLKALDAFKPALKYPASSMYTSFKSSLVSILDTKRSALDEYNFEAKKTDKHSNDVYLNLINYFNGALTSDYNTFIEFAIGDGYYGLKSISYIPLFEIRKKESIISVSIKPFQDLPRLPLVIVKQKTVLSKNAFNALSNYVDFINEALRQINYLQLITSNLNTSAASYKDLTSYKGKGGLYYDYKNYLIPLSLYQKTLEESKAITPLSITLNEQAQVLLNVLKEMDQLSASLEIETIEKRYEKDNLKNLNGLTERYKQLFEFFNAKKEQLYNDVRSIYESYPASNSSNAWYVSAKALQQLVDYNHEALFKAKAYYKGNIRILMSTDKIDQALRDVITNEYSNMKGIERLGRYNGLCPYTPYEDLPQSSKVLSEKLNALKPATSSGYEHPYHNMVYHYNDVVEDFNKFCELSKEVLLLKTIRQPELFFDDDEVVKHNEEKGLDTNHNNHVDQMEAKPVVKKEIETKPISEVKVIHDTIFIQKSDTVYMHEPSEAVYSMDGYAINNMVLLLDVSGSMNTPEKLPLLKKSVLNLLSMMRAEDEVSIVGYSGKAKVLLPPTSFKEVERIKSVIEKLKSEGKTDGNAGLRVAYKVADENYIRGGNNRIILATDGEFHISEDVLQLIDKFSKADIFISVFNFGKSNGAAENLKKLTALGKGNYEFITKENVEYKLIKEIKAKRK